MRKKARVNFARALHTARFALAEGHAAIILEKISDVEAENLHTGLKEIGKQIAGLRRAVSALAGDN